MSRRAARADRRARAPYDFCKPDRLRIHFDHRPDRRRPRLYEGAAQPVVFLTIANEACYTPASRFLEPSAFSARALTKAVAARAHVLVVSVPTLRVTPASPLQLVAVAANAVSFAA